MEDFYAPFRMRSSSSSSSRSRPLSKKVVSIPVVFLNSDGQPPQTTTTKKKAKISEWDAASKIQRMARGFFVRKNLKIVRRLEAELKSIEKSVEKDEDRIRRDEKERIRVGEAIMALLFKLDSVRGVRDYRRRVIRRAIALQESLDDATPPVQDDESASSMTVNVHAEESESIAEGAKSIEEEVDRSGSIAIEEEVEIAEKVIDRSEEVVDRTGSIAIEEEMKIAEEAVDRSEEGVDRAGSIAIEEEMKTAQELVDRSDEGVDRSGSIAIEEEMETTEKVIDRSEEGVDRAGSIEEEMETAEEVVDRSEEGVERTGSIAIEEEMKNAEEVVDRSEEGVDRAGSIEEEWETAQEVVDRTGSVDRSADKTVDAAMIEENRELRRLVKEMCERSEAHFRVIDGLANRIERLENALVLERTSRRRDRRACESIKKKSRSRKCQQIMY